MGMINPFVSLPDSGSYVNLRARILQRLRSTKIEDQIREMIHMAFDEALSAENVVLSQPEKKRLLSQTLKSILEDVTGS
jgi:hypothetical protein